jgi:uncharacterized SAM-binding protein YcdF (DUF218 family)
MFYLKKLLSALVLPPSGLILLALFGVWLTRKHPRLGRGIAASALLMLFALSLPPVSYVLVQGLESLPPVSVQDLTRAQAIVILAGGNYSAAPEYGGDTVNRWTLERVRYGVYLQKRSGLPILVTGGAPYGGRPGGETMKETIQGDFIGQVKWLETASRDTAENAAYSATLLKADGISRIVLVTHSAHLTRAVELFEHQGLEVFAAPTGYSTHERSWFKWMLPSMASLNQSCEALHEWLGILAQRSVFRLSALFALALPESLKEPRLAARSNSKRNYSAPVL